MNQEMATEEEVAFAFNCQGDDLIGFIHKGAQCRDVGVLTLVAGGPQYRGGVGRQLVNLGRRLASQGIPVMRFDHRGFGDSSGSFKGFHTMEHDIAAAIEQFKARSPNVRYVILWGGCDAATAALIHARKFPEVIGVIAGNPFVSSAATAARAVTKHHFIRLMQASFWVKLVRMRYRVGNGETDSLGRFWGMAAGTGNNAPGLKAGEGSSGFLDELLVGLRDFDGKVLFLMGDRFLRSDEFDALMASSPEWRSAYEKSGHERIDIKGGDQVFSTEAAQGRMFDIASRWINKTFPGTFIDEKATGSGTGRSARP